MIKPQFIAGLLSMVNVLSFQPMKEVEIDKWDAAS
jgi:hypothetical protein